MAHITCENLVKVFGNTHPVRALDGLSVQVEEGEVFGLLGPNGSGKTTFVKCCLNIIFPTSGTLKVLGRRPGHPAVTRLIGYLPESPNFYDHLTGRSFLYYHAELAGIPLTQRRQRIDEVLDLVRLEKSASRRRVRTYSKGMLQRIGLAQSLLGKPRLMFLDEPQTGLDPIGRSQIKDVMRKAAGEGTTVLFSSHVLGDVEDVADRVAIIDKGKLRKIAPLKNLTRHTNKVLIRLKPLGTGTGHDLPDGMDEKLESIRTRIGAGKFDLSGSILSCSLRYETDTPSLVSMLAGEGFKIYEVTQERMSLEEVFLAEFGELPTVESNNEEPTRQVS
jgi:ABC-2 type transport system ATP-binding protein